jgi:hypothetical protein
LLIRILLNNADAAMYEKKRGKRQEPEKCRIRREVHNAKLSITRSLPGIWNLDKAES